MPDSVSQSPKTFFKSFLQAMLQAPAIFSILRSWTSYRERTHPQACSRALKLLRRTFRPFCGSRKTQSISSNGRIGWLGSTMSRGLRTFISNAKASSTISGSFFLFR